MDCPTLPQKAPLTTTVYIMSPILANRWVRPWLWARNVNVARQKRGGRVLTSQVGADLCGSLDLVQEDSDGIIAVARQGHDYGEVA